MESQLATRVNLLPAAESIYVWEGKIQQEGEIVAIAKTAMEKKDALES
ncbi:MAG: divalent cation tolerance protein CutA [Verrucomicrobiota bacterium]